MEVFNGVRFVRLRCRELRGKYLAADTDGVGVCLSGQRGVHNAVWAVEHVHRPDGLSVLLRGAYGRYLSATNTQAAAGPDDGVTAAQADLEQVNPPAGMRWQAIRRRSSFVLRCGAGRYLRANGKYLKWRRDSVSVAGDNGSTMMQWAVEIVPYSLTRPNMLLPTCQLTHKNRPRLTERQVTRQIRYVRCELNGDINEGAWRTMVLRSNNIIKLRLSLASNLGRGRADFTSYTLCIRAGRYGRFSPLHIDLPIGNNPINIVIASHGTPVDNDLRYPDLTAPCME